jgi:hypothetical protein
MGWRFGVAMGVLFLASALAGRLGFATGAPWISSEAPGALTASWLAGRVAWAAFTGALAGFLFGRMARGPRIAGESDAP